jgi:type IV fimbrial biogenesis protein FimT
MTRRRHARHRHGPSDNGDTPMMFRATHGFTLIETMVCLAMASVLLAIGIPAWNGMLAKVHAASARADLLATLTGSISHAASTGTEVVICPADGLRCRGGWDWSVGWIAFADLDGDRQRSERETLLKAVPPLQDDVRLVTSKGRKKLVIQPNGGNAGSNVTFTLCARNDIRNTVVLVLSNRGQLRSAPATAARAHSCLES